MLRRAIAFLPFIAPFVLYAIYFLLVRRQARADGSSAPSLAQAPWILLVIAGCVLLVASLVVFGVTEGTEAGGTYIPTRFEDGRIVPGQFE